MLETEPLRRLLARARPPERRGAPVLRRLGVGGRAVARRGGRRRRRGGRDDLRARLRAARRPVRAARARRRARTSSRRGSSPTQRRTSSRARSVGPRSSSSACCRERGLTLATAESCTGGLVAARLTDVPGSSDVFRRRDRRVRRTRSRQAQLGVAAAVLAAHGAVSAETAAAMARGARERLGADVAVSVTGVAGPGRRHARRSPSGSSSCTPSGPMGERDLRFDFPATARRSAAAPRSRRCTSCADLSQSRDRHVTRRRASVGGDERVRLFCALQLPRRDGRGDRRLAARALRARTAARVVPAENLHVTLAFLGSRPLAEVPAIAAELRAAAAGAGPVELRAARATARRRGVGMIVSRRPA